MKNYFENKLTYNQISFCLTDNPAIDEREIHSYHEILLYFDGDVELFTVNGRRKLKKPSLLIIPAETYHLLKPIKSPEFVRLKISFNTNVLKDTPLCRIMNGIKVVDNFSEDIQNLFAKLYEVLKRSDKNTGFYAYSVFLMLVTELSIYGVDNADKHIIKNEPMNMLAGYISDNLSSNLNIKSLAEIFHISPSAITHMFKKEFGIPVHKYIMQKRLIYAKRLIGEGAKLSKIYSDVGFGDYSSFYKAYVKYFGYTPAEDKNKKAYIKP